MEKNVVMNNMQLVTIIADALGIVLVLVGALINYAHRSVGGVTLFWLGWALLVIALILMFMGMRKPMQKMASPM